MQIIGPTNPIVPKKLVSLAQAALPAGNAAAPPAPPAPAPAAPTAATLLTPAQISQIVGKYTSAQPQPMTDAQIQSQAKQELNPLLATLTSAVKGQTTNADNAITGATQGLASYLSGIDYTAPTAGAEDRQAAIDSALQSSLNGDNGVSAAQLAQNWQSIGEPSATAPALAALGTQSTGLANAALANGSASLSNLNADQAANEAYGLKQPGIAEAAGIQQLGQAAATAQGNIASGTQSIESELPTIIDSLQTRSDNRASNNSDLAAKIQNTLVGQNNNIAKTQQTASDDATKNQLSQEKIDLASYLGDLSAGNTAQANKDLATYRNAELGIDQGKLSVAQTNAQTTATKTAAAAGKIDPSVSKILGFAATADGTPKLRNGKVVPVKTGGTPSPLTVQERTKAYGTALTLGQTAFNGGTDAKGKALPPLDYNGAILEGQKEGIPMPILTNALNRFYIPGDRGRPMTKVTTQTQQFFKSLG